MIKRKPIPAGRECTHITCGETCHREKKEKAAPKKITQYSKKRQKTNRVYDKKAKDYKEEHPVCEVRSPVCIGEAQGIHHVAGRIGDNLTDETKFMAACNPCNAYIESHDAWARENGFKKSKFTI